jgi:hypothetical protein
MVGLIRGENWNCVEKVVSLPEPERGEELARRAQPARGGGPRCERKQNH